MSRLADLAKHLVAPDAAVSTGWPKVRDTCNNLGWLFDEWQDDLGRLILSKTADGLFASSLCVMSLPRQVGKTYLVGCIAFGLCLTQPGTTVIWTAHRKTTARETFDQFVILLRNSVNQLVYKHAISTIVPSRNVKMPRTDEEGDND